MDLFDKCKAFTKPNEYREKGTYPYFHCLESRQAKEVVMEGKRRIMLGSNNYLGLTTDEDVIAAGVEAYRTYLRYTHTRYGRMLISMTAMAYATPFSRHRTTLRLSR